MFQQLASHLVLQLDIQHPHKSRRLDATETAVLARELEYTYAKIQDIKYAANKTLELVRVDTSVPEGAETYRHIIQDYVGEAKFVTDFAADLPQADVFLYDEEHKCHSIGNSFSYSVQDLARAALGIVRLDVQRPIAARKVMNKKVDVYAALGEATLGEEGLANSTAYNDISVSNGSWLAATSAEIMADIREAETTLVSASLEVFKPTTLVLPPAHYFHIANTEYSANSDKTIRQQILDTSENINKITSWTHLATADSGNPRGMLYDDALDNVRFVYPKAFAMLAAQARNLAYMVPCHARVGGVNVIQPMSGVYLDGI